ncbi:MAG: cupin-like domain-containing protein [Pelatocladus maniniholoensis HA4357-MV3]|jgi:hypothetical protein|uniref:Cupin-like domain-containing protein n=1 Tax=Pelatocladus maniniholoensis HA4357-MV3 TaxID=1117104 RepID=A0A9E3HBW5_9NOST|nr:cupin-like domain-containing protein [Pelatocladus maniniholoensis HA4357-MV3]BAZ70679.1 hypothetical protein NIES4106_54740 [Fischerella sp. NIES-4106]
MTIKLQMSASILRMKSPSTKQFSDIWKQYQSLVIEDVAKHWDACKKWSPDYLINHCSNNLVPVRFYQPDFCRDSKNFAYEDGYELANNVSLRV